MSDEEIRRLVEWLQATDRPEVSGELLIPGASTERPAFAPNVPVIGAVEFQTTESGLLIPVSSETQPVDLLGSYATGLDVLGEPVAIEDLVGEIEQLCLTSLVGKLTTLLGFLEVKGVANRELNQELLGLCPPEIAIALRPKIDSSERFFTSPQVVLTLMKLALQYARDCDDDVDAQRIGPLLLATADSVAGKVGPEDAEWPLELARYGWFYARDHHRHLLGRLQRLWIEVIPSLAADARYVEVRTAVESATGVPFDTYVALGIGLVSHFSGKIKGGDPPIWIRSSFGEQTQVPQEVVDRFIDYLSAEREWHVAGGVALHEPSLYWDFTSLRVKPLLKVGELYAPISIQMLAERLTDGLFYTVLEDAAEKVKRLDGDGRTSSASSGRSTFEG